MRIRSRGSRKFSLHIWARGTPRNVTSSRCRLGSRGPGGIVENVAAFAHFGDVLRVSLRVHRDHQVVIERARGVAVLVHADFVPGGQTLDIRWKKVLPGNRNAHAENRLHEQAVGAGGTGSVDVGQLDCEIVDSRDTWIRVYAGTNELLSHTALPAYEIWSSNFCMSQAAVGQRSAHRPQ